MIKKYIGRDIAEKVNSHAYIIEGPQGSGRHTAARLIASALSCKNKDSSNMPVPCGECDNCKKILKGISGDVVYVNKEDKATIGVEAIRTLKEGLFVIPNDSDARTYIIEEADKMTVQAQNALLLTLEEPPSFVVFILLTEDSSKLLETVRSRAQTVRTEIFSTEALAELVGSIDSALECKRRFPDRFLNAISLAHGTIGKALAYMADNEETSALLKTRNDVSNILTLLCTKRVTDVLSAFLALGIQSCAEGKEFLLLLDNAVRDMLAVKKTEVPCLQFFTSREEAMNVATQCSLRKLFAIHDEIHKAIIKLDTNIAPKMAITNMILQIFRYRR